MAAEKNNQSNGMSRTRRIVTLAASLFGALLLWIYAIGYDSTLFESTFPGVAVVIEGEDMLIATTGYTLAEQQEFLPITVVAKGKRSVLNELSAEDFKAVVDVSRVSQAGEQTIDVIVYSPNGIEVVSQSTTTVQIFADEFTQNGMVAVNVELSGNYTLAEGITIGSATAEPQTIMVSGPKSVLEQISGAYVKHNLEGQEISGNKAAVGDIELRFKNGKVVDNPYVKLSQTTADINISVTKQMTVPVKVKFTGGKFDESDLSVILSPSTVVVSGTPDALEQMDQEIIVPIKETAIEGTQVFEFPISSFLHDGVTKVSSDSKIVVTVTLPELAVRYYTIDRSKIIVENLPEGYTYEILEDLPVTLIGTRDAFLEFDDTQLYATLNFDRITVNTENGTYSAIAQPELGGEYKGLYAQDKNYSISFAVKAPVILPGDLTEGETSDTGEISTENENSETID